MPPWSSTYKTVTVRRKLQILSEAEELGNIREIARRHKVDPATIRNWRKQKNKLVELFCTEKGAERKSLSKETNEHRFPEMEVILDAWVSEVRILGYSVTQSIISQMSYKF